MRTVHDNNSAIYLDHEIINTKTKKPKSHYSSLVAIFSAFVSLLILVITIQPTLVNAIGGDNSSISQASASSPEWVCSTNMGYNMDSKNDWKMNLKDYPQYTKSNRLWTLQEALGVSSDFVNYAGEGKASNQQGVKAKNLPNNLEDRYKKGIEKQKSKLEGIRKVSTCTSTHLLVMVSNSITLFSSISSAFTQFVVVKAFDSSLICQDPSNPTGSCLNLIKIIGGTSGNSNGGIIGILTSSIYFPLLVLVVAITGGWVLYKGIVQRKLREALFGAIWVIVSVILGVALLLNPVLLAKAPMAVNNVVATCIMGAFNGENCFTQDSSGAKLDMDDNNNDAITSDNICKSDVKGASLDEKMSLTANSMTCQIWKAFVLNPISEGSFGLSFDKLDANDPDMKKTIQAAGLSPNDFCIYLGSTKSAKDLEGSRLDLDVQKNKVCNIMAYQLYLQTNAKSAGDNAFINDSTKIDQRWYKVILVAAQDDGLWSNWAPSTTSAMTKISIAFISLITTALGSLIIFVSSIFALVYYLSSILLMAFAPIFLLIGVHPGRGKSIMLGWLEKVISNVIKYLFSAGFLVITIAIYGGILSNIDNIGLTLLFVIIVTMALWMYRNELMNLIGRVNMGGQQLSSAVTDKLRERGQSAVHKGMSVGKFGKDVALAGIGSSAGAMLAGGNVTSGFKDGIKRQVKRNRGFAGDVMRQYDRNTIDNLQDLKTKSQHAGQEEEMYGKQVDAKRESLQKNINELSDFDATRESEDKSLVEYDASHRALTTAEHRISDDIRDQANDERIEEVKAIKNDDSLTDDEKSARIHVVDHRYDEANDFADLQQLLNAIRDTELQLKVAHDTGNVEDARILEQKLNQDRLKASSIRSGITNDAIDEYGAQYKSLLEQEKRNLGISNYGDKQIEERAMIQANQINEKMDRDRLVQSVNEASASLKDVEEKFAEAQIRNEMYNDSVINYQPGDGITNKTVEDIETNVDKAIDERKQELVNDRLKNPDLYNPSLNKKEYIVEPVESPNQENFENVYRQNGEKLFTSDREFNNIHHDVLKRMKDNAQSRNEALKNKLNDEDFYSDDEKLDISRQLDDQTATANAFIDMKQKNNKIRDLNKDISIAEKFGDDKTASILKDSVAKEEENLGNIINKMSSEDYDKYESMYRAEIYDARDRAGLENDYEKPTVTNIPMPKPRKVVDRTNNPPVDSKVPDDFVNDYSSEHENDPEYDNYWGNNNSKNNSQPRQRPQNSPNKQNNKNNQQQDVPMPDPFDDSYRSEHADNEEYKQYWGEDNTNKKIINQKPNNSQRKQEQNNTQRHDNNVYSESLPDVPDYSSEHANDPAYKQYWGEDSNKTDNKRPIINNPLKNGNRNNNTEIRNNRRGLPKNPLMPNTDKNKSKGRRINDIEKDVSHDKNYGNWNNKNNQ